MADAWAATAADPKGEASTKDLDILLAARGGSHRDGRELIARHGPSMLRTAWRALGSYGGRDAEDVVQEALIAALTTPALPTGDVGAWLRAVTVRKALDWLRQTGRRDERSLTEAGDEGYEPVAAQNLDGRLDVLTLRKGLTQLTATDRAVLTLVDLEGWSMAEAAKTLGLTRDATKLRASRARRKLARLLARKLEVGHGR